MYCASRLGGKVISPAQYIELRKRASNSNVTIHRETTFAGIVQIVLSYAWVSKEYYTTRFIDVRKLDIIYVIKSAQFLAASSRRTCVRCSTVGKITIKPEVMLPLHMKKRKDRSAVNTIVLTLFDDEILYITFRWNIFLIIRAADWCVKAWNKHAPNQRNILYAYVVALHNKLLACQLELGGQQIPTLALFFWNQYYAQKRRSPLYSVSLHKCYALVPMRC